MTLIKKISALTLTLCFVLSLAACTTTEEEPVKVKLEHAYRSTTVTLPEGLENLYDYAILDNHIFYTTSHHNENDQYVSCVQSFDLESGQVETLLEAVNDYDEEAAVQSNRYFQSAWISSDGTLWIYEEDNTMDNSDPNNYVYTSRSLLRNTDIKGNELGLIDLSQIIDAEYLYIDKLVFDKEGNLYFNSNGSTLYVINAATGELAFSLNEMEYINFLIQANDTVLFGTHDNTGTSSGMVLKTIDFAQKKVGETIPLPSGTYFYNVFSGSGDYSFYYSDENGIYGFDLAAMTETEIVNYINSDMNGNQIQNVAALGDGRFIAGERDYNTWNFKQMLVLEEKPEAENLEKTILTLACMYLNNDTRQAIIDFNKTNEEYRIAISDYSKYRTDENYMAGYEQLHADMMGGKIPDILSLEYLNVSTYVNKGLLTDLNSLIDNDPTINRSDLLENVLEAGSIDGKLYQLIASFNIFTAVGKTKNVGTGTGWTVDDLKALLDRSPEGTMAFPQMTKSNFLMYTVLLSINDFINWDTGICSFNSPSFVGLLEIANSFPDTIDWDSLYEDYDAYQKMMETMYTEGRILLEMTNIYNVRAVRDMKAQFGDDVNFIGFPTPSGNGSVISPSGSYAITTKTKHTDACWQFLRTLLLAEVTVDRWSVPNNKAAIEKMLADERIPLKERDFSNGITITEAHGSGSWSSWTVNSYEDLAREDEEKYENYHLTQTETDQIMTLITSPKTIIYQNENISNIITEESEAYFSGQKTAQEVADIIQSRLQIYVSESR